MKKDFQWLSARFEENIALLTKGIRAFPWDSPLAYAHWLAQTYYLVRHTPTYLALSAGHYGAEDLKRQKETLQHLRGETDHELLALADLNALGSSLDDIPELLETSLLYQSQYYWLERFGPVAHVGYALMLEGLASREGKFVVKALESAYRGEAASFLRVHTHEDVGHFEQGLKRLSQAPTEAWEPAVQNLEQSRRLYLAVLDQCRVLRQLSQTKRKAA